MKITIQQMKRLGDYPGNIKELSNKLVLSNEGAKMRRVAEIQILKLEKPTYEEKKKL